VPEIKVIVHREGEPPESEEEAEEEETTEEAEEIAETPETAEAVPAEADSPEANLETEPDPAAENIAEETEETGQESA
jgi:hypothetical protein